MVAKCDRLADTLLGAGRPYSLVAFYLKDGRVEAACALNRSQDANVIKRLIGGTGVSDADLADDAKSLKSLIPASEYV